MDAVPVPNSIIVNIGDMLQIWTGGKFKSTRHRVLIKNKHTSARQSMAYFVHPDNHVVVSPADGSDEFESVNASEYVINKFKGSYS